MLVLSRFADESVRVGDDIIVKVEGILREQFDCKVLLRTEAPPAIQEIIKKSLLERIKGKLFIDPKTEAPIFSMQIDEKLQIGDVVMIIIDIRDGMRARLGFEASEEIPIHRQEVYDDMKKRGQVRSLGSHHSSPTS